MSELFNFHLNDAHLKDLQRDAENARLVRNFRNNENGFVRVARKALGRGLVAAGQTLLDEKSS
jgi:hypothetical protein